MRGIWYTFPWKLCSSACQLWVVQSAVHCSHPNVHWGEVEECAPPREWARVWPWRPPQWAACDVPQTAQVLPTSKFQLFQYLWLHCKQFQLVQDFGHTKVLPLVICLRMFKCKNNYVQLFSPSTRTITFPFLKYPVLVLSLNFEF